LGSSVPNRRKSGYLPGLDGWRAIAISVVVLDHDPDIHKIGSLSTLRLHQVGWAGVDLFFAISGVLICSRLLEEERLHGSISMRDFYVRRAFRILPAAYAYLAVCLLLGLAHQVVYSAPATLAAVLMLRNYWGVYSGDAPNELYTDHFWSLSIEEHFYLFLPAVLVFVRKRLLFLSILSAAALSWFFIYLRYGTLSNNLSMSRTDLRVHGLLIPAVFAILLTKPGVRRFAERWIQPWFWISLCCILGATLHHLNVAGKFALVGVCFPFLVISTMIHPDSLATRALEWKPLRFLGRLSYGLYLWQQIFMLRRDTSAWPFSLLQSFPYNYLALAFCALASYYLLEKRLIAVGHRLAPPATPGRLDLKDETSPQPKPDRQPGNAATPAVLSPDG
jgi:peptidoglycan/LPS O-acetylase OafA/YrhL